MEPSRSLRLIWSLPATVVGAVFCGIWVLLYFGRNAPTIDGLIGLLALIHLIAWLFFIAPFAVFVSTESRLYILPMSLIYGALFGSCAFLIYCFVMATLTNNSLRIWDFIRSWPLITGCALSGLGVAAVMSLLRIKQSKNKC